MNTEDNDLKKKILEEMVVQYKDVLEKNYPIAKKYFGIISEGKIDVFNKDNLILEDQILLYLIGKLYSFRAELADTQKTSRKELIEELSISENSIDPITNRLKNKYKITSSKQRIIVFFEIKLNEVEKTLKRLETSSGGN